MNETLLRAAQVLAFQRRIDLMDDERDDGTREGYWASLTDQTRELMLLRAQSVLLAALDADDMNLWLPLSKANCKMNGEPESIAGIYGCRSQGFIFALRDFLQEQDPKHVVDEKDSTQ